MEVTERPIGWYLGWIGGSLLLLIVVLYLWRSSVKTDPEIEEIQIVTQDILEIPSALPIICQSTLQLLDCVLADSRMADSSEALVLYHQQLISEWNIIADIDTLIQACQSRYTYLTTLQASPHKDVIAACL